MIRRADDLLSLLSGPPDGAPCNISVVGDGDGDRRRVVATRPIGAGEAIGPGLPSYLVVDPVAVLDESPLGKAVLALGPPPRTGDGSDGGGDGSDGDGGGSGDAAALAEKVAFWMALADMAREAAGRDARGPDGGTRKRRRLDDDTITGDDAPMQESEPSPPRPDCPGDGPTRPTRREVTDSYLLSLPRSGPDPVSWSEDERSALLSGTPLLKQSEHTLGRIRAEYGRVASGLRRNPPAGVAVPPLSADGRGDFPSVLWARSMHVSRSFPRSLIDGEGAWWAGRRGYVPPAEGRTEEGTGPKGGGGGKGGDVLSVTLGGCRPPEIAVRRRDEEGAGEEGADGRKQGCGGSKTQTSSEPGDEDANAGAPGPTPPGSGLGVLLPLYDMLDHRSGHPVQWESEEVPRSPGGGGRDDAARDDGAATAAGKARHLVRFRCVCPVPAGSDVHNNYGPKGNPELLVTYGFAVPGNPFDSVDGIVLGARHDGDDGVCRERARLATEGGVPHAIGGGTIRLGPFSLHAGAGGDGEDGGDGDEGGGVIPQLLYRALALVGMEDVDEGPVVTEDELDALADVLRRRLGALGDPPRGAGPEGGADEEGGADGGGGAMGGGGGRRPPGRADFVEWYREGQRRILRLALGEVRSLMP